MLLNLLEIIPQTTTSEGQEMLDAIPFEDEVKSVVFDINEDSSLGMMVSQVC